MAEVRIDYTRDDGGRVLGPDDLRERLERAARGGAANAEGVLRSWPQNMHLGAVAVKIDVGPDDPEPLIMVRVMEAIQGGGPRRGGAALHGRRDEPVHAYERGLVRAHAREFPSLFNLADIAFVRVADLGTTPAVWDECARCMKIIDALFEPTYEERSAPSSFTSSRTSGTRTARSSCAGSSRSGGTSPRTRPTSTCGRRSPAGRSPARAAAAAGDRRAGRRGRRRAHAARGLRGERRARLEAQCPLRFAWLRRNLPAAAPALAAPGAEEIGDLVEYHEKAAEAIVEQLAAEPDPNKRAELEREKARHDRLLTTYRQRRRELRRRR